jgi:DNA-binding MarR family transcriptional regulator
MEITNIVSASRPNLNSTLYETALLAPGFFLCFDLQRAARVLTRRFDEELLSFDLTNGQFFVLMALNRPEPHRLSKVASQLAMDRTTLTAALKPLERRGLVKVSRDVSDQRIRVLTLTVKGKVLLTRTIPVYRRTHQKVEQLIQDGDGSKLRRSLRTLARRTRRSALL